MRKLILFVVILFFSSGFKLTGQEVKFAIDAKITSTDLISSLSPGNDFLAKPGFGLAFSARKNFTNLNFGASSNATTLVGATIGLNYNQVAFCCEPSPDKLHFWAITPSLFYHIKFDRMSVGVSGHAYLNILNGFSASDNRVANDQYSFTPSFLGLDANLNYQLFDGLSIILSYTLANTGVLRSAPSRQQNFQAWWFSPRIFGAGFRYDLKQRRYTSKSAKYSINRT